MNEAHAAPEDHHEPGFYEVRIRGYLDTRWAERFEGMSFSHKSDGTTILSGPVIDQAALHGLLRTVRDLGLTLVSVMQVSSMQATGLDIDADTDRIPSRKETKA